MDKNYLIKIDEPRIQETCDAFFKWKDLNTYVKSLVSRGINMPDAISEPMGCYCLNLLWNKSTGGDAYSQDCKIKYEFKATSNFDYDLSSFGPRCDFDDLVFLRFDLDLNVLFVYDTGINSRDIHEVKLNEIPDFDIMVGRFSMHIWKIQGKYLFIINRGNGWWFNGISMEKKIC